MDIGLLDTLPFGKFRGQKVQEVLKTDPAYLVWLRETKKKDGQPGFFANELHPLLDEIIKSHKSLSKYELWGDKKFAVGKTEKTIVATPEKPPSAEVVYAERWGAF